MAALLLARLLTRPDMPAALADFISWQQQALAEAAGPQAVFLLPGVLQTLAQIYKLGRREQLLQWAPVVWQQLSGLLAEDVASGLATNALARKLAVKLAQRLGLVMLPPQLAGWRYVQAAEDMAKNLQALGDQSAACSMEPQPATLLADAAAEVAIAAACTAAEEAAAAADASGSEELPEIPAEIEDVLGVLLGSCSDRDTIVRWSAAKGVGRLAGCLPCELAEEVVQGVLALLSPAGEGNCYTLLLETRYVGNRALYPSSWAAACTCIKRSSVVLSHLCLTCTSCLPADTCPFYSLKARQLTGTCLALQGPMRDLCTLHKCICVHDGPVSLFWHAVWIVSTHHRARHCLAWWLPGYS